MPSPRPTLILRRLRSGFSALVVIAVVSTAGIAGADDPGSEDEPLDILVFSQPYGFSHTDAIVGGAEWFLGLNADPERYNVVVARDVLDVEGLQEDGIEAWEWLRPERLSQFDLLVWNNSTGEVPFPADERDELRASIVDWVADGHGILGVHSAADSNYTWPAFHEMIGGQYDGHWYAFGGIEWEPYRMQLNVEDPDNPLLAGVDPAYDSHDETYRWQMDVRPDVHVLHSMQNATIGAQGALYHYEQPITWCRPVAEGRSFYTNIGHSGYHFADANYTRLLTNAIEWTGGRLQEETGAEVDCGVGVDPATGVSGAERMGAAWAELFAADLEVSTYSGGLTAATRLWSLASTITYRDVDLTGIEAVEVFAAAQVISPPTTIAITGGPFHSRISPAGGGTVEVRLDSREGPVVASASLAPAPGLLPATTLPDAADPAVGATGPVASWTVLDAPLTEAVDGVHDLVLTFAPGPVAGTEWPYADFFGSLAWINLR